MRTDKSDQAYRSVSPRFGSVAVSKDVFFKLKQCWEIIPEKEKPCVLMIMWHDERQYLPKGSSEWIDEGPGIILAVQHKDELPPDIIETRDGIEFVFHGTTNFSFEDKRLVVENDEIIALASE